MKSRRTPPGAARLFLIVILFCSPCLRAEEPVQHLFLLQFKDDAAPERIRSAIEWIERLPAKIPGIRGLQWGMNTSPEGLEKGFTHGFVMTFESAAARDAYLPHPEHEALTADLRPLLKEVFALDFPLARVLPPAEPGRVHHLVFFKFKESAGEEKIREVNAAFAALEKKIPGLLYFQSGRNNFPLDLSQGFTHGYLLTFLNERARNDYLIHPDHKEFVKLVLPVVAEPLVLDFTVAPSTRGLFITRGLEPYGVYQRGAEGTGNLRFSGVSRQDGVIETRVLDGRRVLAGFDWKAAGKAEGGVFEAAIERVPAGGEYTIEVRRRDGLGNVAEETQVSNVLVGDIWVLAGQSNMEGYGDLVDVEPPDAKVHCFTMAHRWELAEEPLHWLIDSPDPVHSKAPLDGLDEEGRRGKRSEARMRRKKGSGLGLPFANEIVRRTGVPIGLIAAAHGGTSMTQWDPAGRDLGGETLYGSMFKQVKNAGGRIKGVLWYQGESDANPQAVPLYAERFRNLVAACRRDFGAPELPFYHVQIARFVREGVAAEPWNAIQELQRQSEAGIPGTAMVAVIDQPLDDLIHIGTGGLKVAGRRLAKVAHAQLFDAKLARGPRLVKVELSPERTAIRVRFTEVNGGLRPREMVQGFSLWAKDGKELRLIYNAAVDPKARDTVVLKLQSPAPEGTALHYGKGLDPVCNLVDEEDMAAPVFGPVAL